MPFNLGIGEMLVFAVVAILLFGGELPEIARKVGRGMTEFKRGMNQHMDDIRNDLDVSEEMSLDSPTAESTGPTTESAGEPPADWDPPPQDKDCPGMN